MGKDRAPKSTLEDPEGITLLEQRNQRGFSVLFRYATCESSMRPVRLSVIDLTYRSES